MPLLLIPIACCALGPLALAAIAGAGAAVIGATSAAGLVLAVGIGLAFATRRRNRCSATQSGMHAVNDAMPGGLPSSRNAKDQA